MSDSDRPRSPFAGMADVLARTPVRVLSPDEIEQMLAEHRLYRRFPADDADRAGDAPRAAATARAPQPPIDRGRRRLKDLYPRRLRASCRRIDVSRSST